MNVEDTDSKCSGSKEVICSEDSSLAAIKNRAGDCKNYYGKSLSLYVHESKEKQSAAVCCEKSLELLIASCIISITDHNLQ